jgi:squalene-hopene/tetraprenyl-beta-curcumene cyclase
VRDWLLGQQYQVEHPYTHAAPGGWAWTDLPGGVPDADDTPGALLALAHLDDGSEAVLEAAAAGVRWLLELQNSDGGMPTFCRGWGKLPFDRSSADLTAHAIRAWLVWKDRLHSTEQKESAIVHGLTFLQKTQRPEGAWSPLWFGNQHTVEEENLIYGTSRVLLAVAALASAGRLICWFSENGRRAFHWLIENQHTDGGWGGDPQGSCSIEETALTLEAMCACLASPAFVQLENDSDLKQSCERAISRGLATLIERTKLGTEFPPAPIGFYFAKLWYFEKLYPVIYTVSALQHAMKLANATTMAPLPSAGAAR